MGEIVPHLLRPQQESIKTVDGDKKVKPDEDRLAEEVSQILSREDRSRFPSDWDPAGDILVDK
eukprot:1121367-Karenia_brevis.AAC.1